MGQARRRGSFEERKTAAALRDAARKQARQDERATQKAAPPVAALLAMAEARSRVVPFRVPRGPAQATTPTTAIKPKFNPRKGS